jgi:hypothetical protein
VGAALTSSFPDPQQTTTPALASGDDADALAELTGTDSHGAGIAQAAGKGRDSAGGSRQGPLVTSRTGRLPLVDACRVLSGTQADGASLAPLGSRVA